MLACGDCTLHLRANAALEPRLLHDVGVCMQVCELALRAMSGDGALVPAACAASARCCEALASRCMLMPEPEYMRCARACYRAAQECMRVAQSRGSAVPHPLRLTGTGGGARLTAR